MKKFLFLLFSLLTISAFATSDNGSSCPVANQPGVEVSLVQTSGTVGNGGLTVRAYISKIADPRKVRPVEVLVNIYDPLNDNGRPVEALTIYAPANGQEGHATTYKLEHGKAYYFKIHSATCR